jgi:hypothetical protein
MKNKMTNSTYHFTCSVFWIVGQEILSDQFSLSVKPFSFEDESLFLDNGQVRLYEGVM